jgi:hypothetical protein
MWVWIGVGIVIALLLTYGAVNDWRIRRRGGRPRGDIADDRKAVRRVAGPQLGSIFNFFIPGARGSRYAAFKGLGDDGLMHNYDHSADEVTDPGNLGS